jgi:hypothetical protein
MKAVSFRVSLAALLFVLFSLAGVWPAWSDSGKARLIEPAQDRVRTRRSGKGVKPLSYRSPGATHKLMLSADDSDIEQRLLSSGALRKLKKYRAYSIAEVDDSQLGTLATATLERAQLRDDLNLIMLKRGQLDTTGPEPVISADLRQSEASSRALHLVQLFGPPTPESLRVLTATGAKVVAYIPNNSYLMWATRAERQRLHALRQATSSAIQWDGPYHPAYKLDPRLKTDSLEQVSASIEILDTPEAENTIATVKSLSNKVLMTEFRAAGKLHIKVTTESNKLKELARLSDVLAIEPWSGMKLMDERADQIGAGALLTESVNNILVSRPTGPGYLAFLNSLGFNSDFNFAVDVGDTGLDTGSGDAGKVHPDFLNASGASRIAYLQDFSQDFTSDSHRGETNVLASHDPSGHGTLNASLVGGFNDKSGSAFVDAQGFHHGLGSAPFVRIGASKLFRDNLSFANFAFPDFTALAYRGGARISSNSWGSSCDGGGCNLYGDDAQVFDLLVRDADQFVPGNQSMSFVFAAGNDGDLNEPSVAVPGTAKNVIAVGISENVRDGSDRCGVGPTGGDNAQDVIFFSGFGPVQDGRAKPDLVAPGSHMQGAASQDKLYEGDGVCEKYFPLGQTLYTWSSGTSHSTPVVSGAAALAYQWLRTNLGADPSPALVKAMILNSTSYLTGRFAGDTLPGTHQGWGLLNIGRMFENTDRVLLDESPSRTFTQSGGAPFETTGVISDASKEFRVMMAWTDPPGDSVTNAPYVNQLNLEVVVGGVVYAGNHFSGQYSTSGGQQDFVNNVQGVRLPAGTTGPYVIRVRPTIIAGDGIPGNGVSLDQDFSLVATNAHEMAIPVLAIESAGDVAAGVTVQHSSGPNDSALIPGESAMISVTVKDLSPTAGVTIQNATLALNSSTSGSTFGPIGAGQSGTNITPFQIQIPSSLRCGSVATLQLQLDTNAGRFNLPIRVQVGRPSQAGAPLTTIFFDDVDNARAKWKKKGGFEAFQGPATSGTMSFHTEDPGKDDNDNRLSLLFTKKQITIPQNAGQVRLSFFHIFNFEPGYDGGVLEVSTDGGESWQDAGPLMLIGGYDGHVTEASNNPLGSAFAWTARGKAGVFSQVVVDLSDFAGKQIKLRFRGGFDNASGIKDGFTGWFIDDIQITAVLYSCGTT